MRYHLPTFEGKWWDITCQHFKNNNEVSLADIWRAMKTYHLPTFEDKLWDITRSTAHCGLCVTYSTGKICAFCTSNVLSEQHWIVRKFCCWCLHIRQLILQLKKSRWKKRRQTYFNPGKVLPLKVPIYSRFTVEHWRCDVTCRCPGNWWGFGVCCGMTPFRLVLPMIFLVLQSIQGNSDTFIRFSHDSFLSDPFELIFKKITLKHVRVTVVVVEKK